jgi:hypothetical protein
MLRAAACLLLASCTLAIGCDTGSKTENVSDTGYKGQKVGESANVKSGPVPGSDTGTSGATHQPKPADQEPKATQNLDSD